MSAVDGKDLCLADSATTHTILRDSKYFVSLKLFEGNLTTISGTSNLVEGSGRAIIMLPNGTKLQINDALYSTRSRRNLLSFKDIRRNGYHLETINEGNIEWLCITTFKLRQKRILEKLEAFSCGLYFTTITESHNVINQQLDESNQKFDTLNQKFNYPLSQKLNESNQKFDPLNEKFKCHLSQKLNNSNQKFDTLNQKFNNLDQKFHDSKAFMLWHDRLGHPGSTMMRRIIENSHGHVLQNQKLLVSKDYSCVACSQGKLIARPSPTKVVIESPTFLQRIQGDICGPVHPQSGPFRYFMVLIDASTRWSHVCLLSTRNFAFARLLAQIIRLQSHFPDFSIKSIRLDNAAEFTSQTFDTYCMSVGIDVEHPVAHVHTQNGLAESFIKHLQLIARPMLMKTKLPVSAWGHAILHAAALARLRPNAYHAYSPLQLVSGQQPNISHLRVFGCTVYVPVPPPQRTKFGPQRRLGIYVGFESPSIIKYLEPLTGDVFTARFADCHFDETVFPPLGGGIPPSGERRELLWHVPDLSHLDPRTAQCEIEVQKITHLQRYCISVA